MTDKPELVDMITDATSQGKRAAVQHGVVEHVAKERSHLSHWPPEHWQEWRTENLSPWHLGHGKNKNWD